MASVSLLDSGSSMYYAHNLQQLNHKKVGLKLLLGILFDAIACMQQSTPTTNSAEQMLTDETHVCNRRR